MAEDALKIQAEIYFISQRVEISNLNSSSWLQLPQKEVSLKDLHKNVQQKIIQQHGLKDTNEYQKETIRWLKVCDSNLQYINFIYIYYFFLFLFFCDFACIEHLTIHIYICIIYI